MADTQGYTIVLMSSGGLLVYRGEVWEYFMDDRGNDSIHYISEASEINTLLKMREITKQQANEIFAQIEALTNTE